MARRKRKEEEPAWTPPEFDEVGYMRQEIEAARASVLTVAWAAVGAVLSFALFASGQPITAFFAGLLFSVLLYWVGPVLRVRTREFKRRDWAGQGSIYFFSWLAFWILLINAPFGDFTSPSVNGLVVGSYSLAAGLPNPGGMACSVPVGSAISIDTGANDTLYVLFRATDNVAIAVRAPAVTEDVLYPQLRKAHRAFADLFARHGFLAHDTRFDVAGKEAVFLFAFTVDRLPRVVRHEGPPVWVKNAKEFLDKWSRSPKAVGRPFIAGERWAVDVVREATEPARLVKAMRRELSLGKDLDRSAQRSFRVLSGSRAVPAAYSEAWTRLFDKRFPWER